MKRIIVPGSIPIPDLHQYLLGSVAPRPIAFVSTKDENGKLNLAPYSFFNAFSSNPPILIFSSNRRVEGNTTKDTLHNVEINKECVVNVVSFNIVRQMMLCSVDFSSDISEFEQSHLTPVAATQIDCPMVDESPVNMECRVKQIITLGDQGGAGHLIICEVLCFHIDENVLDEQNKIDPHKIDLMGRMGRAFYVRASGEAVMHLSQSQQLPILGYNQLPIHIKQSKILTANDIALLAGMKQWPKVEETKKLASELIDFILDTNNPSHIERLHHLARKHFDRFENEKAIAILSLISA